MLNINGWEFGIIAVLFIMLFGPERVPEVAAQLGKLLAEIRQVTEGATAELTRELELAARDASRPPAPPPDTASSREPGTSAEPATSAEAAHLPQPAPWPEPAPSIFRKAPDQSRKQPDERPGSGGQP